MTEELRNELLKIGKRIKERREALKISQEELSTSLSMVRKHLSSIENGKQNMTIDTLIKISEALDISPYDLMK